MRVHPLLMKYLAIISLNQSMLFADPGAVTPAQDSDTSRFSARHDMLAEAVVKFYTQKAWLKSNVANQQGSETYSNTSKYVTQALETPASEQARVGTFQ